MTDRIRLLGAASELLLFLLLLHILYTNDFTTLGFFGFGPFYTIGAQRRLFVLLFLVFLIHAAVPERYRKHVLLAGGLLGGTVTYPELMPGLLALTGFVYLVVHHVGRRVTVKLACLLGLFLGLGWWSAHSPYGQLLSLVFVALTFFRTLLYLHAMATRGYPATPFSDFLRFQLPIASFAIHPYLGVIPPFATRGRARPLDVLVEEGRRLLRGGLAALLAARVVARFGTLIFSGETGGGGVPTDLLGWHGWTMVHMVVALLDTSACAAFLVGLMLMLGWDLKPAMNRPWFSEGLFEYWNRFIIHFKDFQVTLFFYPTVLALRRVPRNVAVVVGVAMTFLVGNNLVHILGRYLYTAERETLLPRGVRANLALTCVMALAFLWEEYKQARRRDGRPLPFGLGSSKWPVRVVRIYLTLAVVSWVWFL